MNKNIDHISPEMFAKMYGTRFSDAQKEELSNLFKTFHGTKKYHNYTKDIKNTEMAA